MTTCSAQTYPYFFRNLANPLKIKIILLLRKKARNVGNISKELKVEQSKLSHALSSLKKCSIINSTREGKQKIYSLNKKTILPILKLIDKHAKTHCKKHCAHKNKSR